MDDLNFKIRRIYLPYLLTLGTVIAAYSALRWGIDIRSGMLAIKSQYIEIWIPVAISVLAVLLFLWRRMLVLRFRFKDSSQFFGFLIVAMIAFAPPFVMTQKVLGIAACSIVPVESVSEVRAHSHQRYFMIAEYSIPQHLLSSYNTSGLIGRRSKRKKIFRRNLICPLDEANQIWMGKYYRRIVSRHLDSAEMQTVKNSFYRDSRRQFARLVNSQVQYFEKLPLSDKRDRFIHAIPREKLSGTANQQIILVPRLQAFSKRYGNLAVILFMFLGIGSFAMFFMVTLVPIKHAEE